MESLSLGIIVQTRNVLASSSHPPTQPAVFRARFPRENNYLWVFSALLGLTSDTGSLAGQELPKWAMVASYKSVAPAVQLFFWF